MNNIINTIKQWTVKWYASKVIILLIFCSAIISACVIITDFDRPESYKLLWMLPLSFAILCGIIWLLKEYLFTCLSITLIIGAYWIRMVLNPVIMYLGDYSLYIQLFSDNTSFFEYMDEAIILQCYECVIIFTVMLLVCRRGNIFITNSEENAISIKKGYSAVFWIIIFCMTGYILSMLIYEPRLIREIFAPIWGIAPDNVTVGRSLSGEGEGPLGILITPIAILFFILQLLLLPVFVRAILSKQYEWNTWVVILCLICIYIPFLIVTTSERMNSVLCVAVVFFVSMIYTDKKIRRRAVWLIPVAGFWVVYFLFRILFRNFGYSNANPFISASQIFTAYFSGPQNIAGAIQAGNENLYTIRYLPFDIIRAIPYGNLLLPASAQQVSANTIFNYTLTGQMGHTSQLLNSIGAGYLFFGFIFAPIVPLITMLLSVWLEGKARQKSDLLTKSVLYFGVSVTGYAVVFLNWSHVTYFMFFVFAAYIIAKTANYTKPVNTIPEIFDENTDTSKSG